MRAGKDKLRSGYTTGACAAAAARAAAIALLTQAPVKRVRVQLTGDSFADFVINGCTFDHDRAECSVIKDAGDDPDVTDGAEIRATVSRQDIPGVTVTGGKGVGTVTKPGLEIPVGEPAINPVPRRMIEEAVTGVTAGKLNGSGIRVVISVPSGEELARRTLNRRLGIRGGISILGTTGIVIPYSIDAYQASISQALDIAVACGGRRVVVATGRRSEKFAQQELQQLPEECFIQAGDFIGYALEQCAAKEIPRATVWGMTGKISKLAAGHLYTNISDSRVDIGFLADLAVTCGLPEESRDDLKTAVTANHLRRMLPEPCVPRFCDELCRLAAEKCRKHTGGRVAVDCILSDYDGAVLGRSHAGA
ncbi:MAG: cobalt-precorrin-5B (C(1))-methyltransferase [Chloroflexota bacterium]